MSKQSARSKKLDTIMRRIATFAVAETYREEEAVRQALAEAIGCLERAQEQLVEEADA